MKKILYKEVFPSDSLKEFIYNYWYFEYLDQVNESEHPKILEHIVPPDACTSLVFMKNSQLNLKRFFLTPPTIKETKVSVPNGSFFIGVRIMPGAFSSLCSTPNSRYVMNQLDSILKKLELHDFLNDLELGFSQFDALDEILNQTVNRLEFKPDREINAVVKMILNHKGNIKVKDIVKALNLNERTLQRKFKKEVGLSPSEFIRIRKIRSAIIEFVLNNKDYLSVAHERGYSDQSHLIKELKNITGENPSTLKAYLSQIEHAGEIS